MSWFCCFVFRFCFLQFCLFLFFLVFTTRSMFCFSSHSNEKKELKFIEHCVWQWLLLPFFLHWIHTYTSVQSNSIILFIVQYQDHQQMPFHLICCLFYAFCLSSYYSVSHSHFFFLLHCAHEEEEKCFRVTIWFIQLLNHCFGKNRYWKW